jgi:integrase
MTVAELTNLHRKWAESYYRKDGQPTSEIRNVKRASKVLRDCYLTLPAKDFSPLKLQACRERLIADGLTRSNVNRYAAHIVRIFSWATEREFIPSSVVHGLREVRPLQRGRCKARETEPIGPVDDATIEATLPFLPDQIKAMVKLQLLLACRPGELCSMTPAQIDRSGEVWIYRPASHKTQHHEKSRLIPIGPKGQLLLKPWLPDFPAQAVWRTSRGKPISPRYYAVVIARACDRGGIEHWAPNQLRHAGATKIRRTASLDAAQIILGHSSIQTTQVYAEKNLDAALRIAREVG